MKIKSLLSLSLICLLSSCSTKEATQDMDFVMGANYQAPLNRFSSYVPRRVMLLPLSGTITHNYKELLLNELSATLHQSECFLTTVLPPAANGMDIGLKSEAAKSKAEAAKCDAVLFVGVNNQTVYPPLRITLHLILAETQTGNTILEGTFDYDTQNELVANSARRYYQSRLQRASAAPDKSLAILDNNTLFLRYVGYDTAKTLIQAFQPQGIKVEPSSQ